MRLLSGLVATLAVVSVWAPVHAQTCEPPRNVRSSWDAPLDRIITLHNDRISVRAALDEVAAAGRLRFSYSTELIPTDRFICLRYNDAPAGVVLTDILRGTTLVPVVAGKAHIVLTPGRRGSSNMTAAQVDSVMVLDGIVVDGIATRATLQTAGANVTVIEGRDIAQHATVAGAINANAGGIWAWESNGLTTQFGGLRGASSFGVSTPKIYVDGIEVANPLLLAHLDPTTVDRIELIRGPQGSLMYGGNGGVTNIVTRHAKGNTGGDRFTMRSGFGIASSVFTQEQTVAQDHAANARFGSEDRALNLNLSFGSTGEFVPESYERRLSADGSGHLVMDGVVMNGTMRVVARQLGTAASPLLPSPLDATSTDPFTAAQYSAGVTATMDSGKRWIHALTVGADGYSLGGTFANAVLSSADSTLLASGSSALRGSLRLRSTADLPFGSLTISADHSMLRQSGGVIVSRRGTNPIGGVDGEPASRGGGAGVPDEIVSSPRLHSNSGMSMQLDAAIGERLALSSGLRVDRGVMTDGFDQVALLPMFGGTYRVMGEDDDAAVGIALRAGYGKGVRWPETTAGYGQHGQYGGPSMWRQLGIGPEVQAGIEAGVEIKIARMATLQVTRFDQTASGLTQLIELRAREGNAPASATTSVIRNVGAVSNTGWEIQTGVNSGRFGIGAALSIVDSRVQQLAPGYDGDLRVGDRMLAIPAHTASITSRWTDPLWSGSVSAYRASDWINYDRITLANAGTDVRGAALRDYWLAYSGVTHLRATFSRTLNERFTFSLSGDNLLDRQTGEPDNVTVLPGRTISVGLRAIF